MSGLVLVRLPTAWKEREARKPQLEAAAEALLQIKDLSWTNFNKFKLKRRARTKLRFNFVVLLFTFLEKETCPTFFCGQWSQASRAQSICTL